MNNNSKITLCGDSDPAEYFLNTKLSEAQAHARFSKLPPNVLKDQKDFTNEITKVQEKPNQSINQHIAQISSEAKPSITKLENVNYAAATKCSNDVPAINQTHKKDEDDDNSTNINKLMDLMMSCLNGSVLAQIELSTLIRKMKPAPGEIIDHDIAYETCNGNDCSPHVSTQSYLFS